VAGAFPAEQRVRKRLEFQTIQAVARRVVTAHFVLLLCARSTVNENPARLGTTASRRVGNAVVRNRAKRLVREAFRQTRDLWPPGLDLVVIVRRAPGEMRCSDVVAEWRSAAQIIRARIRQTESDRDCR
jgi:ribonuclease P protein component